MSTLLKTLNEQRGANIEKALTITKKIEAEKRGFTDDERNELRGINDDVEKGNLDITEEVRSIANASKAGPVITPSEQKTLQRFDLGTILRGLNQGSNAKPFDGVEAEMIQEGEREARAAGLNVSGVVLPRVLLTGRENRADLAAGTTTAGEELVATAKVGLLGDFYNSSVLEQAGAMILNGLQGNVDLPRYIQATDPAKKAENATADDAGGTFSDLNLSPKRLPAFINISDQLLIQSSAVLETFIGAQLTNQLTAIKEVAFFHGAGTLEPVGIFATSGIGDVVGGTDGAAPDWDDMVDLETAVAIDNALMGATQYFMSPAIRGKLKKTLNAASTDSVKVWDTRTPEAPINGYGVGVTNAISDTLTKGNSDVASAIFFGNANDFVVGYWGGIMLEMVRDTVGAKAGQRTLVANTYYDAGVLRAQSFSAMKDALSA